MTAPHESILDVEHLETDLLLAAVERARRADFRTQPAALARSRIAAGMRLEGCRTISGLLEKVLHDAAAMDRFLARMNGETGPAPASLFLKIRADVAPLLKTYPFVRVWLAGCVHPFDAYELAILLLEEGLYEKSRLYATDPEECPLRAAQDGIFRMSELEALRALHSQGGGRADLLDYCCTGEESGLFDSALRRHLVFSEHQFATDGSLNEFNLIVCRLSLESLPPDTRQRALNTFHESLVPFGVLALPPGETPSPSAERFQSLDPIHNFYRKIS